MKTAVCASFDVLLSLQFEIDNSDIQAYICLADLLISWDFVFSLGEYLLRALLFIPAKESCSSPTDFKLRSKASYRLEADGL